VSSSSGCCRGGREGRPFLRCSREEMKIISTVKMIIKIIKTKTSPL
jgi:hypothetical protein